MSDKLNPAKKFLPEFKFKDTPCPDCGEVNWAYNGECFTCYEKSESRTEKNKILENYNQAINRLPLKHRDLKFSDMEKTPELEKIKTTMIETAKGRGSLYLFGDVGNGKTTMLALTYKHQANMGKKVAWLNTANLMQQLKKFGKEDFIGDAIKTSSAGTLFLDDLGSEYVKPTEGTSFVEEQLYGLINGIYEASGQLFVGSNLSIGKISEKVGERIASRLVEMCVQVENTLPDYRLNKKR